MPHPPLTRLLPALCAALLLAVACAKVTPKPAAAGSGGATSTTGGGGRGGATSSGSGGSAPVVVVDPCKSMPDGKCTDFPADPMIGTGVTGDPGGMFAGTPSGAGPCVTEPEDGALFPKNWLRPRVKWDGAGLTRITVTAENQQGALVAYESGDSWKMPKEIWDKLRVDSVDKQISVEVWRAGAGASTTSFRVAPANAGGSMVFWALNPKAPFTEGRETVTDTTTLDAESQLAGFSVGDESTVPVLKISQAMQLSRARDQELERPWPVRCIGCHVGMPDPKFVAFLDCHPWRGVTASVAPGMTGAPNPAVTPAGLELMRQSGLGIMAFSAAHWGSNDHVVVVPYGNKVGPAMQSGNGAADNPTPRLAWMDLGSTAPFTYAQDYMNGTEHIQRAPVFTEGVHMGFIARDGDTRGAVSPAWSHDGNTIVYASTVAGKDGRLEKGATDLYTVPYNGRKGGEAKPLRGAAETTTEEYYPAISPDDRLVAFTRVPAGQCMYGNPNAEVAVVSAAGAPAATALKANTPPKCSGQVHPGVNNIWARWSPAVTSAGGKTYYWLIFSSTRLGLPGIDNKPPPGACIPARVLIAQLYVTAVVQTETGLETYPAIYLWNQSTDTINLTPAWEDFVLPVVK